MAVTSESNLRPVAEAGFDYSARRANAAPASQRKTAFRLRPTCGFRSGCTKSDWPKPPELGMVRGLKTPIKGLIGNDRRQGG
jgi:hypothetical protein